MLAANEIDEVRSVAHLNRSVNSPDGMIKVTHVCRTVPLPVWLVRTSTHELECSSHHLVEAANGEFVQAARLRPGTLVKTTSGLEPVTVSKDTGEIRPLFDLRVEGRHRYYTNGISSHNSTGIGGSSLFGLHTTEGWKGLYIAPLQAHCKTFADRLMAMQRGSVVPPDMIMRSGLKCNMYYKESLRGGSLKLLHVLTDPTKVRGNSAAHIKVDECLCGATPIVVSKNGRKISLNNLSAGAIILAYDTRNNTVHYDRVVRIVPKGKRHVWRAKTSTGEITCTSNERLWTAAGWRYLAEFIGPRAGDICPMAKEIITDLERRPRPDSRNAARRRVVSYNRGEHDQVCGKPRTAAERLLSGETECVREYDRNEGSSGRREPGLGKHHSTVSDLRTPLPRIFTLHVLPARPGSAGVVPENGNSGVGGPDELAASGLVVPGRRREAGAGDGVLDPLIHEGRMRAAGALADDQRSEGLREKDEEAPKHLLAGASPGAVLGSARRENSPVHAADHAVQIAGSPCLGVQDLRATVCQKDQCRDLFVAGLPDRTSETRQAGVGCQNRSGEEGGAAPESIRRNSGDAGAAGEVPALPSGAHGCHTERPGARESLQRQQEAVAEAEKATWHIGARESVTHLRQLRDRVPEHGRAPNVPPQSVHTLHSPGVQGMGDGTECGAETGESSGEVGAHLVEDEILSIEYAGEQEVFDLETEKYHTFFADGFAVHNCQNFDPNHLPEIEQVQKAYLTTRTTTFAGTSLHKNTCLDAMYNLCSRGVWHVKCTCPKKFHALNNIRDIPKMMSPSGLCCPDTGRLLNPLIGEYVHESPSLLAMRQASFHIPQVIVPEYAAGDAWLAIWKDFKRYELNKFLQEVMGIAVDAGQTELSEDDLKACCDDYGFDQIQAEVLSGKRRYNYIFSGLDWGGSDWNQAARTKQSYTVHSMYGLEPDGRLRLIYAYRYAGAHYQAIAGHIVEAHNKFRGFAVGSDNGGGQYYNAYLRDCGRIPSKRIVHFNYSDVKLMLDRIPHPDAVIASLHRTDSISAVFSDVRNKRIIFPRWEEARPYAMDFLNVTRNITERPSGNTIFRYLKDPRVADDFLHSTNYACMMKRITLGEPLIPNAQLVRELQALFGVASVDLRGSGGSTSVHNSGPGFISG